MYVCFHCFKNSVNLNGRFHASKNNKHHTKFVTSSYKMLSTRKSRHVNTKKSTTESAANNPASKVLIADSTIGASDAMVATAAGDVLIADGTSASNEMAAMAATYVLVANATAATDAMVAMAAGDVLIVNSTTAATDAMAATAASDVLITNATAATNAMAATSARDVLMADATTTTHVMASTAVGDVVIADATGASNAMAATASGDLLIADATGASDDITARVATKEDTPTIRNNLNVTAVEKELIRNTTGKVIDEEAKEAGVDKVSLFVYTFLLV